MQLCIKNIYLQINGEVLCMQLYPGNVFKLYFQHKVPSAHRLGPAAHNLCSALFQPRLNVGMKEQSDNNSVTTKDVC